MTGLATPSSDERTARTMARGMGLEAGYLDLFGGETVVAVREPITDRLYVTASDWSALLRGLQELRARRAVS